MLTNSALDSIVESLFLLAAATLLFFLAQLVLNHSFFLRGERAKKWINTGAAAATGTAFVIFFAAFYLRKDSQGPFIANLLGIAICLVLLDLARVLLDRHEDRARGVAVNLSYKKYLGGLAANLTLYLGLYTAVLYSDRPAYLLVGYALCAFNILRVLKYRVYDDLYKRRLGLSGSWRSADQSRPGQAPQHVTLIQGLYNVFLRTYFYVSTTFAFLYLLVVRNDLERAKDLFRIDSTSGNLFVDFLYFSIFQLGLGGYGDIAPRTVLAKLLGASEMLFGYLVLGSVLALILSHTSPSRE